jgi:hypothetical protein
LEFASFPAFLSQFAEIGDPLQMGDWNLDNILDGYQGFELALSPPVRLPQGSDRLELAYGNGNEPLDQVAVFYLRWL